MLDHVYVVVFSPEDLRIVKDEPEKRRKFVDRELSFLSRSTTTICAVQKSDAAKCAPEGKDVEELLDIWMKL